MGKTPAAVTNAETTGYLYDNAATNAYATEPYNVEHSWNSEELWSQSISDGLNFSNGTIALDDHILIEDDAPGIGVVQSLAWEKIEPGITLLKHLIIERWPVREAILTSLAKLVYSTEISCLVRCRRYYSVDMGVG